MTALVSLFSITMIPIDCKITDFSSYLFVYFFGNYYNIGELISTASKERMTTNITFTVPHLSFVVLYVCPITQHYRQKKHEKYLFLPLYGNMEDLQHAPL